MSSKGEEWARQSKVWGMSAPARKEPRVGMTLVRVKNEITAAEVGRGERGGSWDEKGWQDS